MKIEERKIYYIDVGNMPVEKAKDYIKQFINEIKSKK